MRRDPLLYWLVQSSSPNHSRLVLANLDFLQNLEKHIQAKHMKLDNGGSSIEVLNEVIAGNSEDKVSDEDVVKVGIVEVEVKVLPEIDSQ
ncbi:hypothetical protein QYF36_012812 [Acer negundo]|nr:hypothetical protein QYF36_012812 [Acer negundo]